MDDYLLNTVLSLFLMLGVAVADSPPKQWQYKPSLEVPAEIPEDRCVRAIYLDADLARERGYKIEEWDPPITDFMARWLDTNRKQQKLRLEFCDQDQA